MNWLGNVVSKHIEPGDTILDLGCGVMGATLDTLEWNNNYPNRLNNVIVGVDMYVPYLKRIKDLKNIIALRLNIKDLSIFMDKSFDVVMGLDVVEHVREPIAYELIREMERIARKKVIIYTPIEFKEQDKLNAWELGVNEYQRHFCHIPPYWFENNGYKVTFPKPDENTLAVKVIK